VVVPEISFVRRGEIVLVALAAWFLGKACLQNQRFGTKIEIRSCGMDGVVVWRHI